MQTFLLAGQAEFIVHNVSMYLMPIRFEAVNGVIVDPKKRWIVALKTFFLKINTFKPIFTPIFSHFCYGHLLFLDDYFEKQLIGHKISSHKQQVAHPCSKE